MDAMVLIYGVQGQELRRLRELLNRKGVRARCVKPEEYGVPVGAFCGGQKQPTAMAEESMGEMLVFCACGARQLDMLLAELKTARLCRRAHKTVLTAHNAAWSGSALYAELCREHERILRAETEADAPGMDA